MKKIIFIFFFFATLNSYSQNLVQNWSFEDTIACAINPNLGGPESAPPWLTLTQSPDYFNTNYCVNTASPFGYQIAKTGNAMVGFACTHPNFQGRETFSQELSDTLRNGHNYCVYFYVSLAGQLQLAVDGIAALFTVFPMTDSLIFSFSLTPQIRNPIGNIITDTLNWTLISGTFTAQGGEKYITIGNLFDDANTQIDTMPWGNPSPAYAAAYYYIDDVSVIDCTVGINDISPETFQIKVYPNPTSQSVTIEIKLDEGETADFILLDITGRVLRKVVLDDTQSKFDVSLNEFNNGIYTYHLKRNNQLTHIGKISLIK